MRIGFIGDLHYRFTPPQSRIEKDFYSEVIQVKLNFLKNLNLDILICTGDLVHVRPTLAHTIDKLFYEIKDFKYPIYSIVGNHDTYYIKEEDANVIQTLDNLNIIKRLTIDGITVDNTKIIGLDYGKELTMEEKIKGDIIVMHEMLVPPKVQNIPEAKLATENKNFKYVICGHYHLKFKVANIYNPGVVIRCSSAEENANSAVLIYNTQTMKIEEEIKIPQKKGVFIKEENTINQFNSALMDLIMQIPITEKEKWIETELLRAPSNIRVIAQKYLFQN